MFFRYGNYTHASNSVALRSVRREVVRNRRNFRQAIRHTWDLSGVLIPASASSSAITTLANTLQNAYSDGRDAGLYEDDGTPTIHVWRNGATIGGVRVVSLSFPDGVGAAYVTQLRFAITLMAEFPDVEGNLIQYDEALVFIGNAGPVFAWQVPIVGEPIRQRISDRSTQRIIQSGTAVGFTGPVAPPPPRWPALELGHLRQVQNGTPVINRQSAQEYPSQWSYEFVSSIDLSGGGSVRPITR